MYRGIQFFNNKVGRKTAFFKRLTWKASLLTTLISLLAFTIALAASGDLDTTFDDDGLVTTNVVSANPQRFDTVADIALQPDGKIIAAGYSYASSLAYADFALARYNPDGSLDVTFSGDGKLITNFGGKDIAEDVAIHSNGKIVVSGETCKFVATLQVCDLALARYNADGTLDTTFSGDGKLRIDEGGNDNGSYGGLAIQPNGRIVVSGFMYNNTAQRTDFAVYRFLASGSLDSTFSGNGKVSIGFGAERQDVATDLALQADGKIVVVGYSGDEHSSNNNFAIARLNKNGALDTTFSGDGKQTTNFGANDYAHALALQPNGKIVVVGRKDTSIVPSYIAMARYNTNGNLDTTFNGAGKKVFANVPDGYWTASDMIVQPDGKLVLAGSIWYGTTDSDFLLVRLRSSGGFDTTFSGDGRVQVDFGAGDSGSALALDADGRYVLGGNTYDSSGNTMDFALSRVLP